MLAEQTIENPLTIDEFVMIRDLLYKKSGMFFPENKKYYLEPKIVKRMEALNFPSFLEYLRFLESGQNNQNEWGILFDEITINETFFFRDQPQLEAFEKHILVPLIEARKNSDNKQIRIWSAACSTGEEPLTLAIILLANLKIFARTFDIRITATDISKKALEMAKKGVYSKRAIQYVPGDYLNKYFTPLQDGHFKIKDTVKDLVKYSFANLRDKSHLSLLPSQDVIFCRNVLIYFDNPVRKEVIKNLYNKLNPSGYLFTGLSESLFNISNDFKLIFFNRAKAYKKD